MADERAALLQTIGETTMALLHAMDLLSWARQRLDPHSLEALQKALPDARAPLEASLPAFAALAWPEGLGAFRERVEKAATETLAAWKGFEEAAALEGFDGLRLARRAFRRHLEAERALYPLAMLSPPVAQYYLPHASREDAALLARLEAAADAPREDAGVFEAAGPEGDARGGYAAYIPEYLDPAAPAPVVLALHGGRGNGPDYLWSWLPAARAAGVVLIAPTALGDTWAIMGDDIDSPNLARILDDVGARQALDRARVLLTGMSDGGTFSYVSGLMDGSPATALAPFAASFHPMLLEFVDAERLADLPIRLTHGARDWMFPVETARMAAEAFRGKGARFDYRELPDRAHVFPQDEAPSVLDWFLGTDDAHAA